MFTIWNFLVRIGCHARPISSGKLDAKQEADGLLAPSPNTTSAGLRKFPIDHAGHMRKVTAEPIWFHKLVKKSSTTDG